MRILTSIEELLKIIPILGVNEQVIFQLNDVQYGFMTGSYNYVVYEIYDVNYVYFINISYASIQNAVNKLVIDKVHSL